MSYDIERNKLIIHTANIYSKLKAVIYYMIIKRQTSNVVRCI